VNTARLALGTAQFGLAYGITNRSGQVTPDEIAAVLARARAAGVTALDTAIAYGDAEARLGRCDLSGFSVVTKLPPFAATAPGAEWVDSHLQESRTRLGVRPAAVLLHRAGDLLGPAGADIAWALQRALAEGRVGGIGVSVYAPADLDAVSGRLSWTDVQVPFNVCDRRMLESGWLPRLADSGVRVHARSAFLQGLLLQPAEALLPAFSPWRPLWERWGAWLSEQSVSPLSACLAFVLSVPEVHRVIVGVDGLAHWEGLLAACPDTPIAAPEWMAVRDLDLIDPTRWSRAS
jgi:aryl-alcohol dehydrogenase-like predicted oxidoreductase